MRAAMRGGLERQTQKIIISPTIPHYLLGMPAVRRTAKFGPRLSSCKFAIFAVSKLNALDSGTHFIVILFGHEAEKVMYGDGVVMAGGAVFPVG
jgi:hypothetical protein